MALTAVDELTEWASTICPADPPDLGVVRAVRVLNAAGIETFESCEGGEGHASAVPVVRFYGTTGTGWAAIAACQDHGLPVSELARCWDVDAGEPSGPYWKLVFHNRMD